ncbi:unnamed protein product [Lasius platythorax]|uniref:Uncharacterized protein n=1 Tax=Lasius platythorax TaxID=488582 RepID=A0AAV2N6M8_9HYME
MEQYFEIYEKFDIHKLMLSDKTCVLMAYMMDVCASSCRHIINFLC